MNLNSQTKPHTVPLKHSSSLAVAHSSHSGPSSRPQDLAAELQTDPAPSSRPTHVPTSNEGAVAVSGGLDGSIPSIASSRSRGQSPAQASSSRLQRALVPKRPVQALLDDEESRSTYYASSGEGCDVPNDDDYISDAVAGCRKWQPNSQTTLPRDGRKKTAKRARLGQSSRYEDLSPSTTTNTPNTNQNKYTVLDSNSAPQLAAGASVSTSAQPHPAPRITTNIGIRPTDRNQAEIPILDPNSRIGHQMRHKLRTMNGGDVEKQNEARLALAAWANEVSNSTNTHTERRKESTRYMWK